MSGRSGHAPGWEPGASRAASGLCLGEALLANDKIEH